MSDSLPGYDEWLQRPYSEVEPDPCSHCGHTPCCDPDEARAEAKGWI